MPKPAKPLTPHKKAAMRRFHHYQTYMKIYGAMIMELADDETEVIKLIRGECEDDLLKGLRKRIENSPVYEE